MEKRQPVTQPDRQTQLTKILSSPTYRLAEHDTEFLGRPELRPVRLQLELLKPEMAFSAAGVRSTIVIFGGTQIVEEAEARRRLDDARTRAAAEPSNTVHARALKRAERILAKAAYYEAAREFARIVSTACQTNGECDYVVVTGGGPGIMEAANRGAFESGAKSIGLNITLPAEQVPNPYITPELCFQFHYFALRKLHFLLRARALVIFPGGFGTLDELTDALTLRQTNRMQHIPIVLVGREYWRRVIDFQFLADEGVIADEHLELIQYAETPEEAWEIISTFPYAPGRGTP
ncbi:MAG: TIGR00730 family Rossman fold protein [Planctomycetes bacterium]|nr:TIGR00730 family Rossman fold protein [Planctomycetota bacterium]